MTREILSYQLVNVFLEDSDFGTDENNETFADKELEEEEVRSIPFEIKQAVVEYSRNSKKLVSCGHCKTFCCINQLY